MKAYFDKIAADAFKDELGKIANGIEKKAGMGTEYLSFLNPLNFLASPVGMIAAGMTDTLTKEKMAKQQDRDISNMLVPGVGAYRLMKRLGVGNKEMKMALAQKLVSEGDAG